MKIAGLLKNIGVAVCRVSLSAITLGVLLLCIFAGRLLYAPLNLDFATNSISEQASSFLPGWDIKYETAQIGWNWRSVKPWVTIDNIILVDRKERLEAQIPQIRMDISFVNLFGSAGISTIDIKRPNVIIHDLAGFSDATANNNWGKFFDWEAPPKPEVFRPLIEAFSRFTTRLVANAPRLQSILFQNMSVHVARGEEMPELSLTMPRFILDHADRKLKVSAQVDALVANQQTRINLTGSAEPTIGELSLNLSVRDVSVKALTVETNLPEVFSYLNFPIGLDLSLDLSSAAGLRKANFEVTIGEGYLYHPVAYPDKSPVNYGIIAGALNIAENRVVVHEVDLMLGPNKIYGDGLVYWEDGYSQPGYNFGLYLDKTNIEEVKEYWPIKVHPNGDERGARAWMSQHMLGGLTENVKFNISQRPDGSTPFFDGSIFELTFNVKDVDTYYILSMPPLSKVQGRAALTRTAFDIFINSGSIDGMPVGGSVAHMSNIHKKGQAEGHFTVNIDGGVRQILDLVDRKPVYISDRIKMDLDRLAGEARVEAKISLPLIKKPPKEAISYEITAFVKSGIVTDILNGEGLSGADLTLSLNKDELTASGYGDVNGVPLELYWREDFAKGRESETIDTSLLVMSGNVSEKDIKSLGIDVENYLSGKVRAEATFVGRNLKFKAGYFSADASDATLFVSPIGWVKPVSSPATLNGTILFNKNTIRLTPLVVVGEDVNLTASFSFGENGKGSYSGHVDAKKLGKTQATAKISRETNGPIKVIASAENLDIAPLLTRARRSDSLKGTPENIENADLDLSLHSKRLLLQNGEFLQDVNLDLKFRDGEPVDLIFKALGNHNVTTATLGASDAQMRPFNLQSSNAGGLLRGLGLFAHLQEGGLNLVSETDGWGESLQLAGTLAVRDTALLAKKKLTEEVTEGVIDGLDKYLEDGNVELDVVDVPFSYAQGLLDLTALKANGPSLGMTMEGQIQATEGKINVNGVVVPAYGLNSLLGKIPIVGSIFSGGSGKGLFGVTYRVKGSTSSPDISINPLSGLAPGFLRILFEGRKGQVSDVELPALETEIPKEEDKREGVGTNDPHI